MKIPSLSAMLIRFQSGTKASSPMTARLVSSCAAPYDSSDQLINRSASSKGSLKNELLRTNRPWRSVTAILQERVNSGSKFTASEVRFISQRLIKSKWYDRALEMMEWMEAQKRFQFSAADHEITLELISKVRGVKEAEKYFSSIRDNTSQKAAYLPLLRAYVNERSTEKAEAFMGKLNGLGLLISPHPFNEIMKLYAATSQHEKVLLVIRQMKQNKIPRNVLSYNLWMDACCEVSGVVLVEKVFREMMSDKNVEAGWSTLCTLANAYIKAGSDEKAVFVLKNAEKKLNTSNQHGYFFLITLYSSLKNKEGVLRVWEACKAVDGRITCTNYMCILISLLKIGDLPAAERTFREWESNRRTYDIRVSNVLLGAYSRNGLMEKAETLHLHTLKEGGVPNYKTWEILMEGWVKNENMGKAIDAMNEALALISHCHWRPKHDIVMAIAEYYKKHYKFEEAKSYIKTMHRFGLANLPLYRLLIRMHIDAKKPALDILEMVEKDGIKMDDETFALLRTFNRQTSTVP